MSKDAGSIAAAYFQAWQARDFAALRLLLADNVTFEGPLAQLDNADDCVEGLTGMSKILDRIVIHKTFVDGDDVLTWFDLHTTVADPVPTANWSRIRDGKIAEIRVVFDARPLAPPDAA